MLVLFKAEYQQKHQIRALELSHKTVSGDTFLKGRRKRSVLRLFSEYFACHTPKTNFNCIKALAGLAYGGRFTGLFDTWPRFGHTAL